jgi:DNA invertase Pin-like site-specific DNA recombinase
MLKEMYQKFLTNGIDWRIIRVSKPTNVQFNTKTKGVLTMSVYGYCRISRKTQNIERQERNIKSEYPNAIIVSEAYTGTTVNRKEWNKLYSKVQQGDTIVFDSVSRMSRNAEEGVTVYQELYSRGVELVFLKEPYINTATFRDAMQQAVPLTGDTVDYILTGINQYLQALAKKQIAIAFEQAEKEVQDLHQRTKEGIETARLNGKQIGGVSGKKLTTKKSIEAKKIIRKYSKDFEGLLPDTAVIKIAGVTRNSYYKYKAELKAE